MRTAVAPILLAGLFVAAGLGVLHAIRPFALRPLRRSLLELVAAVGLAYLTGISVLLLIAIALVVAGVGLTLPSFTALALGVAAAGLLIGMRRSRDRRVLASASPTPARADRIVLVGSVVLFGAFALAALTQYTSAPLNDWDAWTIWTRKAIALFSFGTLEPAFWSAKPYVFMHQDYPILLPMLEMLHFRAIGRIDIQSVHVELWFLLVAFPWAFGYLASRTGRAVIWAPIALGAVAAPAVLTTMIGGLADVPVLIFTACGVLALGMWLDRGDRFDLAVATILLAGAASIKNEGLVSAVVALAVAAIVLASRRPRRGLGELGAAAGCWLLAILPWQAWAAHAQVPKDVRLGDALNPAYMADHADRIWPAVSALHDQLLDESRWSYFVPLAILTAVVAIVARRASRAATFYLGTGAGIFAALVLVYWASRYPLTWYLSSSAYRVVGGSGAVSMAALIHLGPRLAALAPLGRAERVEEAPATEAALVPAGSEEPAAGTPERVPARLAFWRA
jgi:hypothetical protein